MKLAHSLPITAVAAQGQDGMLISFGVQAAQQERFGFKPGQYLTLCGGEGQAIWRCYSITSDPLVRDCISVLVKRVPGGVVSNWLCDHASVGRQIEVLPPAGSFLLAHPDQAVLLYAGGSGIAPIYALARQALASGSGRVRLFYANRHAATVMMRQELAELQTAYPERFSVMYWHDDERGLPTAADVLAIADGLHDADGYICGPDPFMRAVHGVLEKDGFDCARLFKEDFGAAIEAPAPDTDVDQACLTVQISGQTHQVDVGKGETLLAAMLRAGLNAPHACKVGECASCTCRLEAGKVNRLENSVLDEDDVEEGWLLACRSFADSTALTIRFL